MIDTAPDTRSLGGLFSDLASNVSTILKNEVELARLELAEKATRAKSGVTLLAAGGAIAYAGFLVLLVAATAALEAAGLPWWVAALIVGSVTVAAGAMLARRGQASLAGDALVPHDTIESVRTNAEWAKGRV